MERRRAVPAVRTIEIMMLGRVRMPGEAGDVPAPFEQGEERLPILQVLIGLVVEKGADGNVHHYEDERVVGRMREHVADERELLFVKPALVPAPSPGFMRIEPEIIDVVEHQEQRLRVEEGVIAGPVDSLEGLAAVLA